MSLNIVNRADADVALRHALVSVSDKRGLDTFIPALLRAAPGLQLFSTGGTHAALAQILGAQAATSLRQVADYTGQPEMQGGLVKTLDFKIYLGLLSETYNEAHHADLQRVAAVTFDLVVVNLYPFAKTVAHPDVTPEQARANIDIGGPCMVRAAAKNFLRVAALTDPADYADFAAEATARQGRIGLETRLRLMRKAFQHTAAYDTAIATYFAQNPDAAIRACYSGL